MFLLRKRFCMLFWLIFSLVNTVIATDFDNHVQWKKYPDLPPNENQKNSLGLASPFAGSYQDMVIVAGGCNFPDIPAAEGGKKVYYSDIFLLQEHKEWRKVGKLDAPVAYGATVSLPEGVLCIGGNNSNERLRDVFLLSWNAQTQALEKQNFPPLPFSLSQMGATVIGKTVYLVGGKKDGAIGNAFLSLDLSKQGNSSFRWEVLPDFPGPAREQAVVVAQNAAEETKLYLFSGSSYPKDVQVPFVNTNGLVYSPKNRTWENIGQIKTEKGESYSLHGGVGVASGSHYIICLGGVNAGIFSDALLKIRQGISSVNKDAHSNEVYNQWKKQYLSQPTSYYKFNKDILVFNTITKKWSLADENNAAAKASTSIVKWNDGWLLISGETKPGIRTPEVYEINMLAQPQFGWLNWSLLILYLLGMLYLGYFFMKKEQSTKDFFTGGGRIPWWAAGISIFATMLSAITFMAIPAKVYATDWKYFPMAVTILIMAFPVVKYYLPFFRRLNVTTAYQYLEKRFNYSTRFLASALFIIFMVARMALVLFLPSLALTTVTGIDIYTCIILMGVITVIYCTMGGVEAVVWGDVVQGIVLMGGALLAAIFLVSGTEGGWDTMMQISIDNEKFKIFDWSLDFSKATIWVVVLGGLANNLISYSSDQTVIQRYLTTKDETSAKRSIILNGFLSIVVSVLFYFIGTALYAYYTTRPEELNFTMTNADAIFPHFIMAEMPMGIAGLLIAAIFAATMSTVSSNVNSISTAFTSDFYQHFFPNSDDKKQLKVARWSGILFGGLGVALALLMATWNIRSLFDYFNYILGLLASGLGGLFFMGIFFPRIDGRSALTGFVFGIVSLLLVNSFTDISFLLFGFIGMIISVTVAWLASFLWGKKNKDINGLTWKTLKK